jgi:hypothetical protein
LLDKFYDLFMQIIDAGPRGFYIGSNNPYIKTAWAKVWRAPKGLNPSTAMIGDDANPAHIIYEVLTDRKWGIAVSSGLFDVANMQACATTLFNEAFGVSFLWRKQSKAEDLVSEMLDHIQASFFVNPQNGLLSLMLFRGDYMVETLRTISPSNATLSNFQRKTWGETINEIVLSYTNPDNEESVSIVDHDNGNIAIQGDVVSDSRNYYGVRNGDLAAKLAARDVAAAAAPLVSCEALIDRSAWDILPGEPVVLNWPEYNIEQIVVRVTTVDYGSRTDGKIKVSFLEDIFAAPAAEYTSPPTTGHEDESEDPRAIDFVRIEAAPAYMVNLVTPLSSLEYPEVLSMVLAAQDSRDTASFDLYALGPDNVGNLVYQSAGRRTLVSRAKLGNLLNEEAQSLITSFTDLVGSTPGIGSYLLIGNDGVPANQCELAIVTDITDAGWIISRGVLDTTPRGWALGTTVWLVRPDVTVIDVSSRSDGEVIDYKILTRTSRGILTLDAAPVELGTMSGRPHFPLRPANVQVNGIGFGSVDVNGLGGIPVTWANRNRLTETGAILSWTDGSVEPEPGQTTVIKLYATGGVLLHTYSGLSGTAFEVPREDFAGNTSGIVEVGSERDGFTSLEAHRITLTNIGTAAFVMSGAEAGNHLLLSGDMQSGTDKFIM